MSDSSNNKNQQDLKKEAANSSLRSEASESRSDKRETHVKPKATQTEKKPSNSSGSSNTSTTSKEETPSETSAETKPKESLEEKSDDSKPESDYSADTARRPVVTDPSKNAYWYVVHTYSGHEQKVSNTLKQRIESLKLKDKILDIIIPTQEKIEIKEGKKSTVKEKIFPGYLLVNMIMDDNSWLAVRTTPGITGFIGTSTKPTPLPEEEVKTIKRYMTMEAPKFKTTFTQGEAVKITDGPFNEFLGTISEIDEEKGKLKIMVSVFGRETPVELDLLQVAKL